jgi:hypothetical protein
MKAERLIFATAPATTVTLTVTGNVIQAATGQLTMKVTKLQAFPAGAVLDRMRRPLKLGVADTVQVDLGNKVVGAKSAPKLLGHEVVVLTEPTAATLAAAAVRPGAYSAGRVVLAASGR